MTYVNPIPANYDNVTITVDPADLNTAATALYNLVQFIGEWLGAIDKALENLTLSWTGSGAAAAQQYQTEWSYVVQLLFGVDVTSPVAVAVNGDWPLSGRGALCVLVAGISQAVSNYDQNEAAVAAMFKNFASSFDPGAGAAGEAALAAGVAQAQASGNQSLAAADAAALGLAVSGTTPQRDAPSSPVDGGSQYLFHTTAVDETF